MTSKLTIAAALLDSALLLYFEGNSYFSSLHLAGGAEEILGAYVRHNGGVPAFNSMQDDAVKLSKCLDDSGIEASLTDIRSLMIHAKNATKHMNSLNDGSVTFDAKYEAEIMLDRAVSNYYSLLQYPIFELKGTELISRFNFRLTE